jgi:hypothetical protein
MKIGTKTLLFGNHQFILHPVCVYIAWVKLYHHIPSWKEAVCILIHDWGYWGLPNIDGPEGEGHPKWASDWAHIHLDGLFGKYYYKKDYPFYYQQLCRYHSSTLANQSQKPTSRLFLADKYGQVIIPSWVQVILGKLTGETNEYRYCPKYRHALRENMTDGELYRDFKVYYRQKVKEFYESQRSVNPLS